MKKSIWIFLLAVLLPGAVLGWLALHSAEEQQIILERRTAELYQKETDAVADAARSLIEGERRGFSDAVRQLLAKEEARQLAAHFTTQLAGSWPRKSIGFALSKEGKLLSPSTQGSRTNPEWQQFLLNNTAFLCSTTPATVYWVAADELNRSDLLRGKMKGNNYNENKLVQENSSQVAQQQRYIVPGKSAKQEEELGRRLPELAQRKDEAPPPQAALPQVRVQSENESIPAQQPMPADKKLAVLKEMPSEPQAEKAAAEQGQATADKLADNYQRQEASVRNVAPQRVFDEGNQALSQVMPATADFRALTSDSNEGVVTRFVQDRLEILFWLRPPQAPEMIFGCLIEASALRELWPSALPERNDSRWRTSVPEVVMALLDDKARPVATQPQNESGRDWKRPFVASEIGEALPHWEAALYLMRPQQLKESARGLRRTLLFLIVTSLGAIACGGWLVVADARRQLALAQKKTDFVSNVSHELKTPLTSIRMFAELMQNGGAAAEKQPQYLRIIMVEAERLTRLINNVLDFARIERRQKRYDKRPLDLHEVIQRTWEGHELHLRESGFTSRWQAAPAPYPVVGDEDALAQILVNLLSNAEKYSGEHKEVELHTYLDGQEVCVSVLDRGVGVPPGEDRKIFEAFYRAHDSLSSGIQGSGLGLTLAQRLATEHGGSITHQPRTGGGSNFTLRLPLAAPVLQPS